MPLRALTEAALLAALALLPLPAPAGPAASQRAGLERGDFHEFDELDTRAGGLSVRRSGARGGRRIARADYCGSGRNGFARAVFHVRWRSGDSVRYGARFRLPRDFDRVAQGEVALMRWDGFGRDGERADLGGVVIWSSDRMAHLVSGGYAGGEAEVTEPFAVPRGRWFSLRIHQRLGPGPGASSEVFVDGRLVAASDRPTTSGREVTRIRYGIVAVAAGQQRRRLTVWFDGAWAHPKGRDGSAGRRSRAGRRCAG